MEELLARALPGPLPQVAARDVLPDLHLHPGRTIGKFELLARVGSGGQGQVWKARQPSLGRIVAMKFLRADRITESNLRRLKREAMAGGRLAHESFVSVIDHGEEGGVAWIAMEYVESERTLGDLISEFDRGATEWQEHFRLVCCYVAEIAEAMQVAHEAGVVHCDLKPSNILLGPTKLPKITDFGLARITDDSLTASSTIVGSPHYMSPEQIRGRTEVDHASDIFSLGVILFEMLALQRPFDGDTAIQVTNKILLEEPQRLRGIRSLIPPELEAICGKALEKPVAMRYRSMAAFAADLRAAVEGRPVSARPPSMLQRGWRWARRFPVVGTALVGGIAVVVTALVFLGLLVHEQRERSALLARTDMGRILVDAEALWPATPATIPRAREWLARAATVASVTKFDQLGDEEHGLIRIVAERIRTIEAAAFASIGSSSAEARWNAACRAIEDHESYGGLQLEPQFGLLPLGADPDSRLWEFAHVLSGEVPARGAEGRLHLAPESGIVLVLVPGGDFDIGAQRQPSGPNYDPEATSFESPVRHVSVPPFFLSKYEMTQAQWFRLTGEQPSYYRTPQGLPGLLPVEQVSWNDAASSLLRFGLRLPDEREWEFAARAATTHRFFFEESRLAEYANVHDATAVRRSQGRLEYSLDSKGRAISLHGGAHFELVEDGYQYTAPVDRFRPNPWGFHGMVGNVREWCGDDYAPYPGHPQESEYRGYSAAGFKVFRGGGYHRPLREARLSLRGSDHPRFLYKALGMRAARSID